MDIKNMFFDRREVGRTVKSSKIYYVWEFVTNKRVCKVELFHSKVSGKKKLVLDGKVIMEDESFSADFSYSFKVEKLRCKLVQHSSKKFELTINSKLYNSLMEDEKNQGYDQENDELEKQMEMNIKKRESLGYLTII